MGGGGEGHWADLGNTCRLNPQNGRLSPEKVQGKEPLAETIGMPGTLLGVPLRVLF